MRRKLLLGLLGLVLMGLVGLFLYAKYGDHRETVERLVSDALGRQLTLAGPFETRVGRNTHLVAEDITLVNPAWSHEAAFIHVDRLEGSIDLWSLVRRPVRLGRVRIQGARMSLEADGEGHASWQFKDNGKRDPAKHDGPDLNQLFRTVEIEDFTLHYRDATPEPTLEIHVDKLVMYTRTDGMLDVEGGGTVNQVPVELQGRIGTFNHLVKAELVDHDLHGSYAGAEFSLKGRIGDYAELRDPDVRLEMQGPDVGALLQGAGMASDLTGPFRMDGELTPDSGEIRLALDMDLGEVSARIQGTLDSLLHPDKLDLEVTGSGPDLAVVQNLPEIEGLPAGRFEIAGGVHHANHITTLRKLRIQAGGNDFTMDGTVGDLPDLAGSDVTIDFQGPDLSAFSTLAGTELPAHPFQVTGHVVRDQGTTHLEDVEAQLGRATLELAGEVGDGPEFNGTTLDAHLTCPDASVFSALTGRELPRVPADVRGRVRPGKKHHLVEGLKATLGNGKLELDGTIATTEAFVGSDVELHVSGPDLSLLAMITGRDDYPDEPFDLAGHFRVHEKGHILENVRVQVGDTTLKLDGTLVPKADLKGSDLHVQADGPDATRVAELAGLEGWPAQPFRLEGDLQVLDQGYRLKSVEATIGALDVKVDGHLGPLPDATGTEIDFEGKAEDLSKLAGLFGVESLPAEKFSARGHARFLEGAYALENVTARLGKHELTAEGTVAPVQGLDGTDLTAHLSGPSLADLNRLLQEAGVTEELGLPGKAYDLTGGVRVDGSTYEIRDARVSVGAAHLEANGVLGALPEAYGTDFSLTAEGPDGVFLGVFLGMKLPHAPFSVSGRIQRSESGTHFHEVKVRGGGYHAEVNGSLGPWPKLIGTRLDLSAEGPGLELPSQFFDFPVEDAPFSLSAHLDGTPEQFVVRDFTATLGSSDLSGSLRVDLTGKPVLSGTLSSKRIDSLRLSGMEPPDGSELEEPEEPADPAAKSKATAKTKNGKPELMLSDDPIELAWLDSFDAKVHWDIDELHLPTLSLVKTSFDLSLQDSHLQIGPLAGEGQWGGTLAGGIGIQPDQQAYQLSTKLIAKQLLVSAPSEEASQQPSSYDAQVDLTGSGNSLHGWASTANGNVVVFIGEGKFDNRALNLLTTDALAKVFDTLNPFRKKERYTGLLCGAHVAKIEDGVIRLDPVGMVTDKMKIVGKGKIEMETEKLDLSWTAKPRRGVGLSASMLTNPYVKLAGTLSKPHVTVKPLHAAGATAAAFGTAGLSLLAKGFWDRFTSTKSVCRKARKKYAIDD